jgi:hypothetical protein
VTNRRQRLDLQVVLRPDGNLFPTRAFTLYSVATEVGAIASLAYPALAGESTTATSKMAAA